MKKIFNKIASISMAFVVLFSTMSFTVDMHFCGGELMDTAIFHKLKTCAMEMQKPSDEVCSIKKSDCCSDKQVVLDGQNELQQTFYKISFEQKVFLASFIHSYSNLFEVSNNTIPSFEEYKPPLVTKQIFKFDETYLI